MTLKKRDGSGWGVDSENGEPSRGTREQVLIKNDLKSVQGEGTGHSTKLGKKGRKPTGARIGMG